MNDQRRIFGDHPLRDNELELLGGIGQAPAAVPETEEVERAGTRRAKTCSAGSGDVLAVYRDSVNIVRAGAEFCQVGPVLNKVLRGVCIQAAECLAFRYDARKIHAV